MAGQPASDEQGNQQASSKALLPVKARFSIREKKHLSYNLQYIGPYDFRDAESYHKNGIYSIKSNVTEFAKFWLDKSKVGQYT